MVPLGMETLGVFRSPTETPWVEVNISSIKVHIVFMPSKINNTDGLVQIQ